jgi:hypothetical protein
MRHAVCIIPLVCCLAGCVSDEPGRRRLPAQPPSIQPTAVGVWATPPRDTDANGFLDTVEVTVYVSSDQYPAPVHVPGRFTFRLIGTEKKELARWEFDEAATEAAMRRNTVGPGYYFRLSMLDVGTDEYEAQAADLAAEFTPRVGKSVSAPLTGLRFGRIRPQGRSR